MDILKEAANAIGEVKTPEGLAEAINSFLIIALNREEQTGERFLSSVERRMALELKYFYNAN